MSAGPRALRTPDILRFWLPLVLTSQMMTLSMPIINIGIARLPASTVELAAYAVGFSLIVTLNSPVLVLHHVTAAVVDSRRSLLRLALLAMTAGAGLCAIDLFIAFTPAGLRLLTWLLRAPPDVAERARAVVAIESILPLLIPVRGLAWGLMLRDRRTGGVTLTTLSRLVALAAIVAAGTLLGWTGGARLGAMALTGGILCEMLVAVWCARACWRKLPSSSGCAGPPSRAWLIRFATPLVIGAVAWTVSRPLINAILGVSARPEVALAGFGILFPIFMIASSPLYSANSAALVLARSRDDDRRLLRLLVIVAMAEGVLLLLCALSPLADWLATGLFQLEPEVAAPVISSLWLVAAAPLLVAFRASFQGFLTRARSTRPVAAASAVKLAAVAVAGHGALAVWPRLHGAALGLALLVLAELAEGVTLGLAYLRPRAARSSAVQAELPGGPLAARDE